MAVIYGYNRAKLTDGLRLEAEFYQPKYLFEVSPHCKWTKIGSILTFCQYGSSLPLNEEGKGYPIFRLNEINDCFLTKPQKWVVMSQREYQMLKLQRDDVLFCRTNGNFELVGRTGILKEDIDAVFASYLVRVRTNPQYILPEFLTIYLNTTFGKLQIQRRAMRSNQVNVSASQLRAIPIPIFAHEFQEKVADFVNHAADKIVLSKHNYAQAEQILLSELGLLDWKPRRTLTYVRSFNQVAKASRMDAEHFHPKYKEMFDRLPSNVYLQLLGKITLYTKGIEVGSSAYTESGIPFLRVSNLSKHGIVDDTVNFISNELYNVLREKYEPQQGEILLSKDATPGIAYFLDESVQGIIASGILRLSLIEDIPPYYLELVLNSIFVQLQIEQSVGGSIIKHWKPSQVQKTWIPRLLADREKEISALVQQSHAARREAKTLLEKAKRAVEIAI
ncbi:MAG TPA: restriction endonuclease subunit S, partial [Acetivibrio sp.]|nr:restriction endonuclease subunit S [Acetivibrio sp.]